MKKKSKTLETRKIRGGGGKLNYIEKGCYINHSYLLAFLRQKPISEVKPGCTSGTFLLVKKVCKV